MAPVEPRTDVARVRAADLAFVDAGGADVLPGAVDALVAHLVLAVGEQDDVGVEGVDVGLPAGELTVAGHRRVPAAVADVAVTTVPWKLRGVEEQAAAEHAVTRVEDVVLL